MVDRTGHKTAANVRDLAIQQTRILLTPQVDRPRPGRIGARGGPALSYAVLRAVLRAVLFRQASMFEP